MAHGQFECGVGEVVRAELVVIHSGLGKGPFGRKLPQECSVSRLFEHRSQPERQLLARGGKSKGGDLSELGTARITQAEEFSLGESYVTDGQGRTFGRARRRREECQVQQESWAQGCLQGRGDGSESNTLLRPGLLGTPGFPMLRSRVPHAALPGSMRSLKAHAVPSRLTALAACLACGALSFRAFAGADVHRENPPYSFNSPGGE